MYGLYLFFFFTDSATTDIYTYSHTLSLHDALPISGLHSFASASFRRVCAPPRMLATGIAFAERHDEHAAPDDDRSEEHTSELQSLMRISYAVFCLKKKNKKENK